MEFVRVGITAISTEKCNVTCQVCVSLKTCFFPFLPICGNVHTLCIYMYIHFVHALYCSLYVCGMSLCMLSCTITRRMHGIVGRA